MKRNIFKIYIPNEIKKPLIWFIIASVVGIVIQSAQAGKFVFVNFFWSNYLSGMSQLWQSLSASSLFGFSLFFSVLFQIFYYIIMTICLIMILYYFISTLGKSNTQKILAYIVIISLVIFLVNTYTPFNNLNFGNNLIPNNSCPQWIIPSGIFLNQNLMPFTNSTWYGNEQITQSSSSNWADGEVMNFYSQYNPNTLQVPTFQNLCHQGSSQGENINLVYCNGLSYTNSTTPISPSGVIGKTTTISYTINLVLQNQSERDVINSNQYGFSNPQVVAKITYYKIISSICISN